MQPAQQPSLGRLDSTTFAFLRSDSLSERNPAFALGSLPNVSVGADATFAGGGGLQRQLSFDPLRMEYLTAAAAAAPSGGGAQGFAAPAPSAHRTRAHGDGAPSARALHAVRQTASFKPERGAAKVRRRRGRARARADTRAARRRRRAHTACKPCVSRSPCLQQLCRRLLTQPARRRAPSPRRRRRPRSCR
jgi:hypothetical protein